MTYDEAIARLKGHWEADGWADDYKAMDMAIEALENADRYRWHDLRENPEDLPEDGVRCIVCQGDGYVTEAFHSDGDGYTFWMTEYGYLENVVAWQPLPEAYKGGRHG